MEKISLLAFIPVTELPSTETWVKEPGIESKNVLVRINSPYGISIDGNLGQLAWDRNEARSIELENVVGGVDAPYPDISGRPAHRDRFQAPRDLYERVAVAIESEYLLAGVYSPDLRAKSANSDLRKRSRHLHELRAIVRKNILIGVNSPDGEPIHGDLNKFSSDLLKSGATSSKLKLKNLLICVNSPDGEPVGRDLRQLSRNLSETSEPDSGKNIVIAIYSNDSIAIY